MTLLIRNVQVLGTERDYPDRVDVFASGDRIAAIGQFPKKSADEIIEGQGIYLSPGFIDVHTHSDHYFSLFDYHEQADFLRQGITTIVGGNDGVSLAPLLYGELDLLKSWTQTKGMNVDWRSVQEFFRTLSRAPLGINFGTLIGHSTIRDALTLSSATPRKLTKNEMRVFNVLLATALREGGLGLSIDRSHAQMEFVTANEIRTLLTTVYDYHGVYAVHLEKTGPSFAATVQETIKLARETGVKTLISHFLPVAGKEDEYRALLSEIDDLPDSCNFHFDLSPLEMNAVPIITLLPEWLQRENRKTIADKINDDWYRPRILNELPKMESNDLFISQAPGNESLIGLSLGDIRKMYSEHNNRDALLRLLFVTKLRGTVFLKNVNHELLDEALRHPRSLIASNGANLRPLTSANKLRLEHSRGAFTEFLALSLEKNLLSLQNAIRKITHEPAKKFGLTERGIIKEGFFADLVGFKDRDIKFVIVNGRVMIKNGELRGKGVGRILRNRNQKPTERASRKNYLSFLERQNTRI